MNFLKRPDRGEMFADSMLRNEQRADKAVAQTLAALIVLELLWMYLITIDGNTNIDAGNDLLHYMLVAKVLAVALYFVTRHFRPRVYKYMALTLVMVSSYVSAAYLSYNLMVLLVLPALLTTLYNDRRLLAITAPIGAGLMLRALWVYNSHTPIMIGMWYGMTDWDILKNLINTFYMYSLVIYVVILVIAVYSTNKGLAEIRETAELMARTKMADRELEIASSIQNGMLPSSLPQSDSICLSASMVPAKEVGGDFYDCFTASDGRVVVVIADVSGKGVPASLFMMSASSILHSALSSEKSLRDAVSKANNEVYRSNSMKYFVTMWLGVLDPKDGTLEYVNAGHNPPFIVSGHQVSRLENKPDFVFGRRKDIVYHSHRTVLGHGDRLFLYTDGVTEARSSDGGFFGEDRLVECLGNTSGCDTDCVLTQMSEDISEFAKGAARSDDITMMAVDYLGNDRRTLRVPADRSGYSDMMSYLDIEMSKHLPDGSARNELRTICSEVFANIDMYGYDGKDKGTVEFRIRFVENTAEITFSDDGIPFDPTEYDTSETSPNPRDHKNGGLGITLVKKLSQDLSYEYAEGRNILTITKEI